jgi:hypothetical protein
MKNFSVYKYLKTLLSFILLFSSPASLALADEYNSIEPGWRVGPIIMNMTREQIESVYGQGEYFIVPDPDRSVKMSMLQYKQMGLVILFKNNRINLMEVTYPMYSVKDTIKVGSSKEKVEEVMGRNYVQQNYQHSFEPDIPDYKMIYKGITYHIKGERVIKITVTRQF